MGLRTINLAPLTGELAAAEPLTEGVAILLNFFQGEYNNEKEINRT